MTLPEGGGGLFDFDIGQWGMGIATSADGVTWSKHPANPVITGDPEGDVEGPHSFGTVLREADTGTFRMWAGTTDREILERGGKKAIGSQPGVYYESDDGIERRRPELGLFEDWGG